jgi:hypothetical protein
MSVPTLCSGTITTLANSGAISGGNGGAGGLLEHFQV